MKNTEFYILREFKEIARDIIKRPRSAEELRADCAPFYERLKALGNSHADALDLMRAVWIDLAAESLQRVAA